MYKIKQFFRRIYNLYRWFPIIWNDQDWDTHYIWEILKFKLKNQAKYIGTKDRHISAKRDAEIMMLCTRLIDKVQSEYYSHEYSNYQQTEFISTPSTVSPGNYEIDIKEISENFDEYFIKYPRIWVAVNTMKDPPFKKDTKAGIAINIAHINHLRARRLLFNILEENIEKWWD